MSTQRLKYLLEELAESVGPPAGTGIDAAWTAGRRRSRRGHVLVTGAAVATLLVGTAIAVGTGAREESPPPTGGTPSVPTTPPERPTPSTDPRPRDATYEGVPVWWAPPAEDEDGLGWYPSVLPMSVTLAPGLTGVSPGERAMAVFTVHDARGSGPVRLVVLLPGGVTRELPAPHIEANRDRDGNAAALTPFNGGLAPDGRHLLLAQQSSIELYDFGSGEWTTIDTPDWLAEGARWLDPATIWVPNGLIGSGVGTTYDAEGRLLDSEVPQIISDLDVAAADEPYGIWVDTPGAVAGSYFFYGPIDGGPNSNPEGIVARIGDERSILALSVLGRGKGCCPMVGWLDDDVVAFESGGRVLAWRVGTRSVFRVTEPTGLEAGESYTASWAWQALR